MRTRFRRLDDWGIASRSLAATASVVMLIVAAWVWPTVDAYGRALAFFSEVILERQIQPAWLAPDVVSEELRWPDGGVGVLTRPRDDAEHAALLLILGAEPADPDDPRVRRLTGGLARIGIVTVLTRTERLIDGRVTPDEVPLLVGAFRAMRAHPAIRDDRVGFVGLSTGGSLQLVAAADPAIADHVWMVLAMGSYDDAGVLTAEVLSGEYVEPSGPVRWEPDETALRVVRQTLLAALPPSEADLVSAGRPAESADGRVVEELLRGVSLQRAEELLQTVTPTMRAALTSVSPRFHLQGVRAPVYLLHDRKDPFIPWTHSEAMAAAHNEAAYHKLDIFAHVEPDPGSIGVLLRDGSKLLRVFSAIIRDGRE
jgi:dienelactone hydrolase